MSALCFAAWLSSVALSASAPPTLLCDSSRIPSSCLCRWQCPGYESPLGSVPNVLAEKDQPVSFEEGLLTASVRCLGGSLSKCGPCRHPLCTYWSCCCITCMAMDPSTPTLPRTPLCPTSRGCARPSSTRCLPPCGKRLQAKDHRPVTLSTMLTGRSMLAFGVAQHSTAHAARPNSAVNCLARHERGALHAYTQGPHWNRGVPACWLSLTSRYGDPTQPSRQAHAIPREHLSCHACPQPVAPTCHAKLPCNSALRYHCRTPALQRWRVKATND